jgi:Rod binding domain-containing protein
MNVSALPSGIGPAHAPLEKLAANPRLSEQAKVAELSRQFEAMLLRQILGEAQKTLFPSEANPQSFSGQIYRDLLTEQLAESISQSGDFGLSRSLETQLGRQLRVEPLPQDDRDPP